jgi:hypothetical protein
MALRTNWVIEFYFSAWSTFLQEADPKRFHYFDQLSGGHLDKFMVDIQHHGNVHHSGFDQIEKRKYQDGGCHYLITIPVDRICSEKCCMENLAERHGWSLFGLFTGWQESLSTIATVITKNHIDIDYHLFVLFHSAFRITQGYVGQLCELY